MGIARVLGKNTNQRLKERRRRICTVEFRLICSGDNQLDNPITRNHTVFSLGEILQTKDSRDWEFPRCSLVCSHEAAYQLMERRRQKLLREKVRPSMQCLEFERAKCQSSSSSIGESGAGTKAGKD